MGKIGERALIPLTEEIALCRAHLEILGLAHGRRVDFEVDGGVESIELPPGTLHTLVENGLTHAGAAACAASAFHLTVRRDGAGVNLELRSALGHRAAGVEGTGTQFIRASLEAAFPAAWAFSHGSDGSHWHSRIELQCVS
jgi:LytS/YehU family sensor histidine kinase